MQSLSFQSMLDDVQLICKYLEMAQQPAFKHFNLIHQLILYNDSVEHNFYCFYFFIADQTAQVGQPMVFNWARHFGQSGQQQRNTATVAALTNQHEHLYLFVATVLFHKFASTTVPRVHVLCFVLLQLPYNVLMPQAVFVCCCLEYPTCLASVIRWARQLG